MSRYKVLVVDDEANVRSSLRRVLESTGNTVLEADNPKSALAVLLRHDVAVIITDERMPECSGLDFMRMVKQKYPNLVRIMLTGHADVRTVIDAVNNGEIFRFFTKPWKDDELLAAVRQAIMIVENQKLEDQLRSKIPEAEGKVDELETRFPGITHVVKDEDNCVIIDDDSS